MRRQFARGVFAVLISFATVSPALACEEEVPNVSLGASIEPGINAGTLVLAFHNPHEHAITMPMRVRAEVVDYDWLTVELAGAQETRTLGFLNRRERAAIEEVTIDPGATHVERIELDAMTRDLPRGEYAVTVYWGALQTTASTFAPYRCGLEIGEHVEPRPARPADPEFRLLTLVALAFASILLGRRLGRRGVEVAHVPHSVP